MTQSLAELGEISKKLPSYLRQMAAKGVTSSNPQVAARMKAAEHGRFAAQARGQARGAEARLDAWSRQGLEGYPKGSFEREGIPSMRRLLAQGSKHPMYPDSELAIHGPLVAEREQAAGFAARAKSKNPWNNKAKGPYGDRPYGTPAPARYRLKDFKEGKARKAAQQAKNEQAEKYWAARVAEDQKVFAAQRQQKAAEDAAQKAHLSAIDARAKRRRNVTLGGAAGVGVAGGTGYGVHRWRKSQRTG